MKVVRVLVLALSVAVGPFAAAAAAASTALSTDHLIPANEEHHHAYRQLVQAKFGRGAFDCGRVVVEPAFEPESSVAIHCDSLNNCVVTYLVATESLWERTDGGRNPSAAASVNTKRVDAQLPSRTAGKLRKVWMRMLQATRPRADSGERVVPTDATDLEFSIKLAAAGVASARIDWQLPKQGEKTRTLIALCEDLISYCKAAPFRRTAIMPLIDAKADRLLR
jgi:hypothetical protein